jgi:hypothetical protein
VGEDVSYQLLLGQPPPVPEHGRVDVPAVLTMLNASPVFGEVATSV